MKVFPPEIEIRLNSHQKAAAICRGLLENYTSLKPPYLYEM